jgi:hypothetical protein
LWTWEKRQINAHAKEYNGTSKMGSLGNANKGPPVYIPSAILLLFKLLRAAAGFQHSRGQGQNTRSARLEIHPA